MGGRLSCADDAADLVSGLRQCMNDEDRRLSDNADSLSALLVREWVGLRQGVRIGEDKLRGFEAQSVLAPVLAILGGAPCPRHPLPPFVVTYI